MRCRAKEIDREESLVGREKKYRWRRERINRKENWVTGAQTKNTLLVDLHIGKPNKNRLPWVDRLLDKYLTRKNGKSKIFCKKNWVCVAI